MLYEWLQTFRIIYILKKKSKYKFKVRITLQESSSYKFQCFDYNYKRHCSSIVICMSVFAKNPTITFLHEYGHILDIMTVKNEKLLANNGYVSFNDASSIRQNYVLNSEIKASKCALRLSKLFCTNKNKYREYLYWAFGTYLKLYKENIDKANLDYKAFKLFGIKDVIRF